MTTQFPVILSPALQRERDAPEHLSKQLVCDDIEVYITRLKPQSSGWAMLYCKSLNCIMVWREYPKKKDQPPRHRTDQKHSRIFKRKYRQIDHME